MIIQAGIRETEIAVDPARPLRDLNGELGRIADAVRPSLVRISSGDRSAGAGVVLHERGLVVTNAHVIERRPFKVLDHRDNEYAPTVLRVDPAKDLAALMIQAEGLPALSIGDSRSLLPGAWVLAFGHPYGVMGAVTAGVVIGSGEPVPERVEGGHEWLTLSLRLRPGNSGGPVVDSHGRLVGLNAMMAGPGVGLAVPGEVIKGFLRHAML